ncbi:MAG: hypothetical protein ABIB79_01725 [archaeon]
MAPVGWSRQPITPLEHLEELHRIQKKKKNKMTKSPEELKSIEESEPKKIKHCINFLERELDRELEKGKFKKDKNKYHLDLVWERDPNYYSLYQEYCLLDLPKKPICDRNFQLVLRYLERRYEKKGWKSANIEIKRKDSDFKRLLLTLEREDDN